MLHTYHRQGPEAERERGIEIHRGGAKRPVTVCPGTEIVNITHFFSTQVETWRLRPTARTSVLRLIPRLVFLSLVYFKSSLCNIAYSLMLRCRSVIGIKMPIYPEKVPPALKTWKANNESKIRGRGQARGRSKQRPYGCGEEFPSHGVTFSG